MVVRVVMRPCECLPLSLPREMRIKDIVAHLFDDHIAGKKNWTLDQLVAWVQSWEPKEINPVPIANSVRFGNAISPLPRVEGREAEQEWQEVRRAFEVRHRSQRSGK